MDNNGVWIELDQSSREPAPLILQISLTHPLGKAMIGRTVKGCAALGIAALMLIGASDVRAQSETDFSFHLPHHNLPYLDPLVQDQCASGYSRRSYQGRITCVACPSGYTYTKLNGGDNCVRCDPGYSYVTNAAGHNLCVLCPAGYSFMAQDGRNFCRQTAGGPATPAMPFGTWTGTWSNNLGERGTTHLQLTRSPGGGLAGVWDGMAIIGGQLPGLEGRFHFQTRSANRAYRVDAHLSGDTMTLRYVATRLDGSGVYQGEATIRRVRN